MRCAQYSPPKTVSQSPVYPVTIFFCHWRLEIPGCRQKKALICLYFCFQLPLLSPTVKRRGFQKSWRMRLEQLCVLLTALYFYQAAAVLAKHPQVNDDATKAMIYLQHLTRHSQTGLQHVAAHFLFDLKTPFLNSFQSKLENQKISNKMCPAVVLSFVINVTYAEKAISVFFPPKNKTICKVKYFFHKKNACAHLTRLRRTSLGTWNGHARITLTSCFRSTGSIFWRSLLPEWMFYCGRRWSKDLLGFFCFLFSFKKSYFIPNIFQNLLAVFVPICPPCELLWV